MKRPHTLEGQVDVHDVIDVSRDEPAQVTLPPGRVWRPSSAVGVVAVVRNCDDRVQLEANGLKEMVV